MRKYKSTNDARSFCLHDAIVNKAYIKGDEELTFEFNNDRGVYILASNKENPYDETKELKDVVIRYNDVDFDSSRFFIFKKIRFFRRTVLTIREEVSWKDLCDNINNEKWRFEIVDETYGYNQVKLMGYIHTEKNVTEFNLEIYHLKDIEYYWNDFEPY